MIIFTKTLTVWSMTNRTILPVLNDNVKQQTHINCYEYMNEEKEKKMFVILLLIGSSLFNSHVDIISSSHKSSIICNVILPQVLFFLCCRRRSCMLCGIKFICYISKQITKTFGVEEKPELFVTIFSFYLFSSYFSYLCVCICVLLLLICVYGIAIVHVVLLSFENISRFIFCLIQHIFLYWYGVADMTAGRHFLCFDFRAGWLFRRLEYTGNM